MVHHNGGETMNEYKPVLLLARKSLISLGMVVAVCLALAIGLGQLVESLQASVAKIQTSLQEQKTLLDTKQTDLSNVREHIQQYSALRAQGFVGEPDRALWVEQLQESYRRAHLPGDLLVELSVPKPLAGGAAPGTPGAPAGGVADTSQAEALAHDLQFEMANAVETDVLRLIQDYQAEAKGRFRVNMCKVSGPAVNGFTAKCVLRFVSMPSPAAKTS